MVYKIKKSQTYARVYRGTTEESWTMVPVKEVEGLIAEGIVCCMTKENGSQSLWQTVFNKTGFENYLKERRLR